MSEKDDAYPSPQLVPAVARATAILELLGEAGVAIASNEIARRLDFPKSSTANICLELEAAGLEVGPDAEQLLVVGDELGGRQRQVDVAERDVLHHLVGVAAVAHRALPR